MSRFEKVQEWVVHSPAVMPILWSLGMAVSLLVGLAIGQMIWSPE